MLVALSQAYAGLIEGGLAREDDARRLLGVLDDLRWYAERLGPGRWERSPRPGRWSFAENLRHVMEQAPDAAGRPAAAPLRYFVDHGKEHVGQAAELLAIFAYDEGAPIG
jgi:hypothetical protein